MAWEVQDYGCMRHATVCEQCRSLPQYIMPVTRNLRARHMHDASTRHCYITHLKGGPNGYRYPCTFAGCLRSFNNEDVLTQHSRLQHLSRPASVTAPLFPSIPNPKHLRYCP
ncbi:hypothetical protein BJV78DRAFT_1241444 [Lactifluus subvellereus]|nr:hypothetical protein BJV78DRAFT_1241444 [Lactifluus subvellereus]